MERLIGMCSPMRLKDEAKPALAWFNQSAKLNAPMKSCKGMNKAPKASKNEFNKPMWPGIRMISWMIGEMGSAPGVRAAMAASAPGAKAAASAPVGTMFKWAMGAASKDRLCAPLKASSLPALKLIAWLEKLRVSPPKVCRSGSPALPLGEKN